MAAALTAPTLEQILLGCALMMILSVLASKASDRLGVPALLLFLGVGMLAGSEGVGGIAFSDAALAQRLGVLALAFILFAGGLDTNWQFVRGSVRRAASLSTIGVLITAFTIAWFASTFLEFTLAEGLLLGGIVSATDAAAVFAILRGRGIRLKDEVVSTLELESGTNDPMAVFLTTSAISIVQSQGGIDAQHVIATFLREMSFGAVVGLLSGLLAVRAINWLKLDQGGLYTVFTVGAVLFTYSVSHLIHGNPFLAVYLAGILMGNRNFVQRRTLTRFHDGVAWLMQIGMFLTLGLLVYPSQLLPVAGPSLMIAIVLIFVARPLAVYVSLLKSRINFREKTLIGWVGLRGAVPIILATFPLLAGVPKAATIFNIVFFITLTSVALQGTTIPIVAKWLRVDRARTIDMSPAVAALAGRRESALITVEVKDKSPAAGKRLVDLPAWPREAMILVLYRGDEFFVPDGSTTIQPDDRLIILTNKHVVDHVRALGETVVA